MIQAAHIAVGHGGRTHMIKELNCKYKNMTVESIFTYLILCEPCQKKQKTLKKGFSFKPCKLVKARNGSFYKIFSEFYHLTMANARMYQ
jgi:hypothetical protein